MTSGFRFPPFTNLFFDELRVEIPPAGKAGPLVLIFDWPVWSNFSPDDSFILVFIIVSCPFKLENRALFGDSASPCGLTVAGFCVELKVVLKIALD